jgi:hypothetical protein
MIYRVVHKEGFGEPYRVQVRRWLGWRWVYEHSFRSAWPREFTTPAEADAFIRQLEDYQRFQAARWVEVVK